MNPSIQIQYLLRNVTAAGPGQRVAVEDSTNRVFQVVGKTSSGVGAVEVDILGGLTDDIGDAVKLGTVSLTLGTTPVGDGFTSTAPWRNLWARVNSLSGTGATVAALVGA